MLLGQRITSHGYKTLGTIAIFTPSLETLQKFSGERGRFSLNLKKIMQRERHYLFRYWPGVFNQTRGILENLT